MKEVEEIFQNNLAYKKIHFKTPEAIQVFGQFGKVSSDILKDISISHSAKFYYSVLKIFRKFDKNDDQFGKTVLSERFLFEPWVCGSNQMVASRDRCVKWRKELERCGLVSCEYSPKGWEYSFLKENEKDHYECITKKLVLTDKLNLKEKTFIINLLPHILSDDNTIKFSNNKLREKTGYDVGTIRRMFNSLEKKGLLYNSIEGKYLHLGSIMAGHPDNYVAASEDLFSAEKFRVKQGCTIDEYTRAKTGE